ncbi:LTA synthase family protein [Thalassobacillus pellis]|uniref:LTA synthase family protein n=1 Tax=Thalassobacillus pellis TaxID=748008 RepID=UPI00196017F0|nr:LTA synthase family protein [Thalassobacillus pellis]MBM7552065.1 phosphoglycerol transferase MdoB-like AlkP superfamily enzyme [Thalassobacillus pellis]
MNERFNKMFRSGLFFFVAAVLLLWAKTYLTLKYSFSLDIENTMQEIILILTPLGSILFFLGLSFLFSKKRRVKAFLTLYFIMSFVLFANAVYYRFFSDFITIPVLMQYKNFLELGGSAKELMGFTDLLLWVDFIALVVWAKIQKNHLVLALKKRTVTAIFATALLSMTINLSLAEAERPELLTRTFDRAMLVKLLGIYNFHVYDGVMTAKTQTHRAFAESSELSEVQHYTNAEKGKSDKYFGAAEGKNVVLVSMESLQNFVIDYKLNGQEVTPFLNDLVKDENSLYFSNFYHNTGQGKTSDSEFIVDNSLYGLPRGAVFTTNSGNEYNATPEILGEKGYTSAVFHGNNDSFWNRDVMYKSLGYDHFFSEKDYNVTPENSVNYGLKDIPFFEQSIPKIKNLEEPYYTRFITLTHHYPFVLNDKEDIMIEPANTGDGTVDRYFQTARYMDEALKQFFQDMKEAGEYKDTIFVFYGDHYGISTNHNKAMSKIMGEEIRPFEEKQLQQVPLIIHAPGLDGKEMKTVGSQIDLKPTILHLLGVETPNDVQFGTDLLAEDRKDIAIFRDGSVITDEYVYAGKENICYDKQTEKEIKTSVCKPLKEKAQKELSLSDKVVYGDLLRFLDENAKAIEQQSAEK